MEKPVTFENKKGEKLFGIVHTPEPIPFGEKKVGISLLDPGIKYRVAPNRLNVKLARRLCQNGYYVLRFDPAGIGDSEGELDDNVLVLDIWEKIQMGLFVNDTIAANEYFVKTYTLDKLISAGTCGGAITSLLTSAKDARIDALCLIDVPVNLRAANMSFVDLAAEGGKQVNWLFHEYIKRGVNPKSWYRCITFKTDFKALWKVLNLKFQKVLFPSRNHTQPDENIEKFCHERKLNKLFFESFEAFVAKRKPILFVLAGNDPGTEIFQLYFQNSYLRAKYQHCECDELVEVFLVKNANHVYTLIEWQESLIIKICSWIEAVNA